MGELVTVRLLTTGPNKNYRKGQTVCVDEHRAAALVASKDAEEVKDGAISSQEQEGI